MTKTFLSYLTTLIIMLTVGSCNNQSQKSPQDLPGSFGYDLKFLKQYDHLIVLKSPDGKAQVIVSPKYQAKVFTSTADGPEGTSFGWINYKAFTTAVPDPHMNAYGGENRLWLGPEGGPFSLFFRPGAEMVFKNWKTPAAFDTEDWQVASLDSGSVSLKKEMTLTNYSGTTLTMTIIRKIKILSAKQVVARIGIPENDSVKIVGYDTENTLANTGTDEWTEKTGMPCIWILDMFRPSEKTTIVIPYRGDTLKPATTDYFGEITKDRIHFESNILYFKADGKSRGKLGIHPLRANHIAGSFDAERNILTITLFDIDNDAKYLNQEWLTTKPPFSGDAVNAYNDGPLAAGGQLGPFYEIESVSPAAFLKPGASLTHHHSVFHFTGSESELNRIAEKTLGVSIDKIKNAFQ